MGCIVNVEAQSTNLKYDIEDSTGKFQVTMWTNADDSDYEKERAQQWQMGTYVQVIGSLRSFNNTRNLVAFDISTITDYNAITHHMLEAIYTHLRNTKKGDAGMGGGMGQQGGGTPMDTNSGGGMGQQGGGRAIKTEGDANNLHDKATSAFQQYGQTEEGLDVAAVHAKTGGPTSRLYR